jgi:tetratricopeptide (TPR) repeat protein
MRDKLLAELTALLELFNSTGDPELVTSDAARALALRLALVAESNDDLEIWWALGSLHWDRHLCLPGGEGRRELDLAAACFGPVFAVHPERLPEAIRHRFDGTAVNDERGLELLANRGLQLPDEAHGTGDPAKLKGAIDTLEQVVATIGTGNRNRAGMLSTLGGALHTRYRVTEQLADLDRAVDLGEQAVAAETEHPNARNLYNHGVVLSTRYERTQQLADLDRAVDVGEQAVAAVGDEDPNRAGYLSSLGAHLVTRFGRTGQLSDLDRAVNVTERAVTAATDHLNRAAYLSDLGNDLLTRFGRTGQFADLNRSVEAGEQAVADVEPDDPNSAGYLSNLCCALRTRYERIGRLADIHRSVEVGELSVAQAGSAGRATHLANLGACLHARYWRMGQVEDLDRAVEVGEQAVAEAGVDHPGRAEMLSGLGITLRTQYRRNGQLADLNRSVEVSEQAVAAQATDHPGHLSNLGGALFTRYERNGQLADLDRSIDVSERAVTATRANDPERAMTLSTYSGALLIRYLRTGKLTDLDRAIEVAEQALAVNGGNGDLDHAALLTNLSAAMRIRYARAGQLADLDRAVELAQQAVSAAGADHPDRAIYLTSHANILLTRFERIGQLRDLDGAVEVGELAVIATGADDPHRAAFMYSLAGALRARSERTKLLADLDRAEELFRDASRVMSAPPIDRARAARSWALAAQVRDWGQAVEGYAQALELLGQVAPRWLGRADQEHWLAELSGIGRDAAAACLQAGLPERAVELFERGRGVLFSQTLDSRTDVSALDDAQPELAQEFIRLTGELDRDETNPAGQLLILGNPGALTNAPGGTERRQRAGAELQALLGVIRSKAGFETFMQPSRIGELLPAAGDGPVVLINVAKARSDALILGPTGVDVIPLPRLDPAAATVQANKFFRALGAALDRKGDPSMRDNSEAGMSEVLGWLWDSVSAPVLDHLGLTSTPGKDRPWTHVHWCPSGPLTALPLQAAGHHETRFDPFPATVIDRVISSTIPTVRALANARRSDTPHDLVDGRDDGHRVLVVAMPVTNGQSLLPGADGEAKFIRDLLPGIVDIIGLPGTPSATFESVASALPAHSWAHFSCHGANDPRFPSASYLLLEDYQTHPLTVLDLSRARLQDVEFAYLSACATALTGNALPDESIHLAAAFQIAGYRHVVATLWPIDDADAVMVTQTVYEHLTADGSDNRADKAAAALHNATRILRSFHTQEPSRWAAHTHTGP